MRNHMSSTNRSMLSESSQVIESFYHPNLRDLVTMTSQVVLNAKVHKNINIHYLLGCSEVDMLLYLSKNQAIPWIKLNSVHLR